MILIQKSQLNEIIVTITEKETLTSPYYLFYFVHEQSNKGYPVLLSDVSTYKSRYNQFNLTEGTDLTFDYTGDFEYFIYEQVSDTNLDPDLADNLLESGKMRIDEPQATNNFYTPQSETNNIN